MSAQDAHSDVLPNAVDDTTTSGASRKTINNNSTSEATHPCTPHQGADSGLSSAIRAVSGVTLLSRFGGMIRDIVLVRTFGDTAIGSSFATAFAIPNLFRRLFGEGALSAAFLPIYTQAVHAGEQSSDQDATQRAERFASIVIAGLGVVTGGLTVLVELILLALLLLTNPNPDQRLSIGLIMVMLPFMPMVCVTAIKAGMLQTHGKFAASMSGPLLLNAFIIGTGMWCWLSGKAGGESVAYLLGGATTLSGLTQMLYFQRLLRPHFRFTKAWNDPAARQMSRSMLKQFMPVLIGLGTLQVNTFIDTLIAMWPIWIGPTLLGREYPLETNSGAIISFTQRLYQFPLGVFGIAVATAAFPMLSRHANDHEKFLHTLRRGLRLSVFIGLPASLGLMLVRTDATAVLFGFGKNGFSADGLVRSADVLLGFASGIWAYSVNHLLTRAFYARGDTRAPMRVSLGMVILNASLNFTLIWPLREAGLAWSTSLCAMIQCGVLLLLTRKRLLTHPHAHILDRHTFMGLLRVAIAAGVMTLAVYGSYVLVGTRTSWQSHMLGLTTEMAVGAASFVIVCILLRVPELRWLLSRKHHE